MMVWKDAPRVKQRLGRMVKALGFSHIDPGRVVVYQSSGSKSKAIARIWSLPRVWQQALSVVPHYVLEVVGENFAKLSTDDQDRTLIHELLHIPKNFSGALVSHRGRFHRIDRRSVEVVYQKYLRVKK